MKLHHDAYDLLSTASRINRAGRELVPLLRALPKPMRRTAAEVATTLAERAEKRGLASPGQGVCAQIDALIAGCDRVCSVNSASAETLAQAKVLRERLADLQALLGWLGDQLEARRGFSPAPRR